MRNIIKNIILCICICTILYGCGTDNKKDEKDICLDMQDTQLQIQLFIEGEKSENLSLFEDSLKIRDNDVFEYMGTVESYFYINENAAYLQFNTVMYRFQFNKKGNIESYIKYSLEA